MRKTKEILRLKWHHGVSHRQIVASLGVGLGTPSQVAARAKRAGLTSWADVAALCDEDLDARLYPRVAAGEKRAAPDPAQIHIELRRPGVTLRLLHEEYLQAHANGYGYTRFVAIYNTVSAARTPSGQRRPECASHRRFSPRSARRRAAGPR